MNQVKQTEAFLDFTQAVETGETAFIEISSVDMAELNHVLFFAEQAMHSDSAKKSISKLRAKFGLAWGSFKPQFKLVLVPTEHLDPAAATAILTGEEMEDNVISGSNNASTSK